MVQEAQRLPENIAEAVKGLPRVFRPERASGVKAIIQFKFTGPEPGDWFVTIADDSCRVEEGEAADPSVTIHSPSDVWLKISRRELDGASAFMSGQFTFTGDMGVLMQMGSWFGAE